MPPKAKSKVPPPSAQFAFTQRTAPPPPAPLPAHRLPDVARTLLAVKDGQDALHLVALFVRGGTLCAHDVTCDVAIHLQCPSADLAHATVTQISGQDGGTIALVSTEAHGVLIVGKLPDEPVVAHYKDELVAVRQASTLHGSGLGAAHKALSVATAHRHALALVVDGAGDGGSAVCGYGFTDMSALGPPPPNRTTIHATDGLGRVARPKLPMHDGALTTSFLPFAVLRALGSYTPTAVFATRHLSFVVCAQGILACGYLSQSYQFTTPRLVYTKPNVQVLHVAATNRGVYALLTGNRILRMVPPTDDELYPEPTMDEDGCPMFVDVTAVLGLCSDALDEGADDGGFSTQVSSSATLRPHAQLAHLVGGADHCLVVDRVHGAVYGWGSNTFGQLGQPPHKVLDCLRAVELEIPLVCCSTDGNSRPLSADQPPISDSAEVQGASTKQSPSSRRQFASVHAFGMTTILLDASKRVLVRYGR